MDIKTEKDLARTFYIDISNVVFYVEIKKQKTMKFTVANIGKIRFLTSPVQRFSHFHSDKIIPCDATYGPSCVSCDAGIRVHRKWLAGVIDRESGTKKIFEFGGKLFSCVQELVRQLGDPTGYDIDITIDHVGAIATACTNSAPLTSEESKFDRDTLYDLIKKGISYPALKYSDSGWLEETAQKAAAGATCDGCKEFFPYADYSSNFKCWGCKHGH